LPLIPSVIYSGDLIFPLEPGRSAADTRQTVLLQAKPDTKGAASHIS